MTYDVPAIEATGRNPIVPVILLEQQADVSPVPRIRSVLALLAWALLVFAAARPRFVSRALSATSRLRPPRR